MPRDAASNQLADHQNNANQAPTLTTSNGAPVDSLTASMTAGSQGPIVLQDFNLIDHMAHFDRERIPERVVHAKGAGAFGYFEVTTDYLASICKADLFSQVGKRTPVAVRFSTVGGESGSADTARDPRGFAIKFFTNEGNWDLVGNNTPIFFIRDPILFPSFLHTQKRNPATHLADPDMFWDFISLRPETTHQVSFLFSDRGTPNGYRHMNGYGSHTFKNVNANNNPCYVKYHFKTDQGVANLTAQEAATLASADPDYATRDLYNAIANKDYPSWTMYVQVMTYAQASSLPYNPFDLTKVWSHSDFPLHEVGRLVLDQNPTDYFTQIEQIAFAPSHLVPGIEPSPDKMLQARLFSYPDTHRHRLGANYQNIPVNQSRSATNNYQRDGPVNVLANGAGGPNYFPNSFNGPQTLESAQPHADYTTGQVARYETGDSEDNFTQAGQFYRNVLDEAARDRLTDNIAGHLSKAQPFIQKRAVENFCKADSEYGRVLQEKLQALRSNNDDSVVSTTKISAAPLNPPRAKPELSNEPQCPFGFTSKGAHGYAAKL